MKRTAIIFLISICCVSCSDNITTPDGEPEKSTIMHITEPYLLEYSDWILPDTLEGNPLYYSIPDSLRDVSGTQYDFYFYYWAYSSCNGAAYVYNYTDGLYDQVVSELDTCNGCYYEFVEFNMMVGKRCMNVSKYINSKYQINLKHFLMSPYMRVFLFNERYEYITIPGTGCDVWGINGITYDGESFWVTKQNPPTRIYKISRDGMILETIDRPPATNGLAYDGENLWVAGHGAVVVLSTDGTRLGDFNIPYGNYPGMAWGNDELWMMGDVGDNRFLFRVDPESSLNSGEMVAIDTLYVPTPFAGGLAWDGNNVIVAGDSLYVCTPTGDIPRRYRIPVRNQGQDITWDGESIWVLHIGPKAFHSSYSQIGRFGID